MTDLINALSPCLPIIVDRLALVILILILRSCTQMLKVGDMEIHFRKDRRSTNQERNHHAPDRNTRSHNRLDSIVKKEAHRTPY